MVLAPVGGAAQGVLMELSRHHLKALRLTCSQKQLVTQRGELSGPRVHREPRTVKRIPGGCL